MTPFQSNCTLPSERGAFVTSPNVRGSLNLVWSCLSILLLCTWSILHLAVPVQSTPQTKRQEYVRHAKRLGSKTKWMLLNLVAPEWPFAKAWSDYTAVSLVLKEYQSFKERDNVPWSRAHCHFANMGGFAVKFSSLPEPALEEDEKAAEPEAEHPELPAGRPTSSPADATTAPPPLNRGQRKTQSLPITRQPASIVTQPDLEANWGVSLPANLRKVITHFEGRLGYGSLAEAREWIQKTALQIGPLEFDLDEANTAAVATAHNTICLDHFPTLREQQKFLCLYVYWFFNLRALRGKLWVLDAHQLLLAREMGLITALPSLTRDELDDRNKSDELVKLAALGQILWFLIQLIARLATGAPTSQLEVLAFAYATTTAFTYALLLDRPKDVTARITLPAARRPTPAELSRLAVAGPTTCGPPRRRPAIPNNALHAESLRRGTRDYNVSLGMGTVFAVAVFGAAHCLAWDFAFPSPAERTLWRTSAVVTAGLVPALVALATVLRATWQMVLRLPDRVSVLGGLGTLSSVEVEIVVYMLGLPLFVAARVFTLVEVVRTLGSLPPGVFAELSWPASIPHVG